MRNDWLTYLQRALADARVIELRHNRGGRWESGTFDNMADLTRAIRERSADGALYSTLNRPTATVARNDFGARALCDDDIGVITRIVFDLDPRRPTDTPSTDAELAAAMEARTIVSRTLAAHGWPAPAAGMSGNGGHLVYRACIENSPTWRQRAATLYAGLRGRLQPALDELGVQFDVTVRNPARIWRLYGCANRKGTATSDRPHREASISLPAGAWQTVRASTIETTVVALTPVTEHAKRTAIQARGPIGGSGDFATLDVVAWFTAHGAYRRPLDAGKHAVSCPWIDDHSTGPRPNGSDSVVWERSNGGWPTFHCSHDHCAGRSLLDVIALWRDADSFCAQEWRRDHG